MSRQGVRTLILAAVLSGVAAPASAQDADEPAATELDPILVTPRHNPLDESLERLRNMMENAPCLGCGPEQDAARANPYGRLGRIVTALTGLGAEPPDPTLEERRETRVAEDWRVSEYGPEMEAFR